MDLLARIAERLIGGDEEQVAQLTQQAIDDGLEPQHILDGALVAAMDVVGDQFKKHDIFLPEVLLAAKAMHAGVELLKPLLAKDGARQLERVVLGTVEGDLHDIGKNLVAIMLRGAGFEVIDLGNDVSPDRFVDAAEAAGASAIGMSALLTTTMPAMKRVVECVKERGLAGRVKTIIGGAPVSESFAMEIGADAYGYDAANAVDRMKALISG